jgi:hypothetical protein
MNLIAIDAADRLPHQSDRPGSFNLFGPLLKRRQFALIKKSYLINIGQERNAQATK